MSERDEIKLRQNIVIGLIGDSGDGIQLMGARIAESAACENIDVNTLPVFPAEIRAPAGTLAGVSSYQISLSDSKSYTPGDKLDILVAMNPAALKKGLKYLNDGGLVLINSDSLTEKEWNKAGYKNNPLETIQLSSYRYLDIPITTLTKKAINSIDISISQAIKCKNMFALGLVCWMLSLTLNMIESWLKKKFRKQSEVLSANLLTLHAGFNFAETSELFYEKYKIMSNIMTSSLKTQISGNEAFAMGCLAAAIKSKRPFLLAGYPITPASSLLHFVSNMTASNLHVFQAEDEMAAACSVIGASFGGTLAATVTSGPGFDLKSEAIGLGVMVELPFVIINVQRAGPSTGMPTKPEQSDLLAAVYGRHGECPVPVLAAATPGDCFYTLIEAFKIAIKYMTPVILLSDAHLANATECWEIPEINSVENLIPEFAHEIDNFMPYSRHEKTFSRPWAIPGMKGFEHRIGGLEKENITGNVSYESDNHQLMINIRNKKIERIADDINSINIIGKSSGDILVISWGSTYGSIFSAIKILHERNKSISLVHLRYINPLPKDLEIIVKNFKMIIIPELNSGQLSKIIRERLLINVITYNKVNGMQFSVEEILQFINSIIENTQKV